MSDHNSETSNFYRAKPKKCSFKKFNLLANLEKVKFPGKAELKI